MQGFGIALIWLAFNLTPEFLDTLNCPKQLQIIEKYLQNQDDAVEGFSQPKSWKHGTYL